MSEEPIINPTGTCFDDAAEFVEQLVTAGEITKGDHATLRIVHALCVAPTGEVYAHGWLEYQRPDGDIVIFCGIAGDRKQYFIAWADEYYDQFEPVDVTRYDLASAAYENIEHRTTGPWEDRYIAKTGKKIYGAKETALQCARAGA